MQQLTTQQKSRSHASLGFIACICLTILFHLSTADANSRYYGQQLCHSEKYFCIDVKRGDTWASLFPDKKQRQLVMRLNRTNIALYYRSWILVPHNLEEMQLRDISPFHQKIKPRDNELILIDMKKHAFAAYGRNGQQIHWGPISGGKDWCSDIGKPCHTVVGRFKIERKQGSECISKTFPLPDGGAKMPYCMFFFRGFAMHASQLPGFHASHGCVRMLYEDAKWLNQEFAKTGVSGTEVIVIR